MENLIEFLSKWVDREAKNEDSYLWEDDNGTDFWNALDNFLQEQKHKGIIKVYSVTDCGGFESCGYEICCNVLSIIDNNGELSTYVLNQELY